MTALLDLSHTACRAALADGAPVFLPVNPVKILDKFSFICDYTDFG